MPPTIAPIMENAVRAARFWGENPQSRCKKVGYMSWVPCETKFIPAINSVRYRNSFQCDAIPRPRLLQSLWRGGGPTPPPPPPERKKNGNTPRQPPHKKKS